MTEDDEHEAVYAMLQYLYTADYDVPISNSDSTELEPSRGNNHFDPTTAALNIVPFSELEPNELDREPESVEIDEELILSPPPPPTISKAEDMMFHLKIYALGDRIQNEHLKCLAENKFEKSVQEL
jgi:hypothetical protein